MYKGDANELIRRYNERISFCQSKDNRYATWACSGLMIRGVRNIGNKADPNSLEYAWLFKQINLDRKSFSVAYLRIDSPFSQLGLGYLSGFIIFPYIHEVRNKDQDLYKPTIRCAFPVDAKTDQRSKNNGCTTSLKTYDETAPTTSNYCDLQEIKDIHKWKEHYTHITRNNTKNLSHGQCAFDMTKDEAHEYFNVVLQASAHIRECRHEYSTVNNELLLKTWKLNESKNIPIEAFFFLLGYPEGEKQACKYQCDYHNVADKTVPVVGIRLPIAPMFEITIQDFQCDPNSCVIS